MWMLLFVMAQMAEPMNSAPVWSEDDAKMLLRVSVSEAGFGNVEDATAIHDVLRDVQRRISRRAGIEVSFAYAARAYSSRATGAKEPRTGRQKWISRLQLDCRRPRGYPSMWDVEECEEQVDLVKRTLDGKIKSQCKRPPHHWGCDCKIDNERAKRARFEEVDCGATLNRFWRYPKK